MLSSLPTAEPPEATSPPAAVAESARGADAEPGKSGARGDALRGLLALVDQGLVSLASFVTFMLVAKLCPRSDVNLYALAWAVLNVFRVLQERALAAPYVVFAHERDRDTRLFLGSSLSHQAALSLVVSVLLAVVALGYTFYDHPAGMAGTLLVTALVMPFLLLRDHLRAVSCAHFRFGVAIGLSGVALALQVGLVLLAYRWWGTLDVRTVFVAMGVASLVPTAVWLAVRPQPFRIQRRQVVADWRTTSRYSRWLVAARFFPTVTSGLLPWIVLWQIGENASGALAGCLTLTNVSMMFVFGVNSFFQPQAVKAFHDHGKRAMMRVLLQSMAVFTVVLSAISLLLTTAGDWLLVALFDESFAGYGAVVAVLSVYVLILSYSMVAGNGMAALGKPQGLFWGEVAFSLVTMLLAVLLAPQAGLVGVAVAMCCGAVVATLVAISYLRRYSRTAIPTPTQ